MKMIDVIIPVYRPDEKLQQLIEKLNTQTRKPEHVFFMQTLVGDEEDERVRKILEKADRGKTVTLPKSEFDHGGTRNLGASLKGGLHAVYDPGCRSGAGHAGGKTLCFL